MDVEVLYILYITEQNMLADCKSFNKLMTLKRVRMLQLIGSLFK